jgi:hypothetical protein
MIHLIAIRQFKRRKSLIHPQQVVQRMRAEGANQYPKQTQHRASNHRPPG